MKKIIVVGAGRTGSRVIKKLNVRDTYRLKIIDRDVIEETDVRDKVYSIDFMHSPKALAARQLWAKSAEIAFDQLTKQNAGKLLGNPDLIIDCTDNYHTRAVINGYCKKKKIKWIYSSALREFGMVSTIDGNCFTCFAKKPVQTESCSLVGVNKSVLEKVGDKVVEEAKTILGGKKPRLVGKLFFASPKTSAIVSIPKRKCLCKNTKEEKAFVLCGNNQFLFTNKIMKVDLKKISSLKPVDKKHFVQVTWKNAVAKIFPKRILVNSGEKTARELNELILQKLGK